MKAALDKIRYTIKPLDIVLIHTGAGAIQETQAYLTDHVGMTGEATHWLLDQGVKVAGIDAVTFDPPVWAMFERKKFWEAHRVMIEREYYHLENMTNFDQLAAARLQAERLPGQMGEHDGRSGPRRRDHRGLGKRGRELFTLFVRSVPTPFAHILTRTKDKTWLSL